MQPRTSGTQRKNASDFNMFAILRLFHTEFDTLKNSCGRQYQQIALRHANVTAASLPRNTSGPLVIRRNQR
jgi:hypothetical protein